MTQTFKKYRNKKTGRENYAQEQEDGSYIIETWRPWYGEEKMTEEDFNENFEPLEENDSK